MESEPMMLAKLGGEAAGVMIAAVGGVLAASAQETAGTYVAISAWVGFAGLLVRHVVRSQQAVWRIVAEKDAEIAGLRDQLHYAEWEQSMLRYSYGERSVNPGPYQPRHRHGDTHA